MMGASLAIGAASAIQQNRAAKKAANKQNYYADQNLALNEEEYQNQLLDMREAQALVATDAVTEESERVRAAREEAATITAIAGEYGDGNNTQRLLNDAAQEAAQDVGTIRLNTARKQSEIGKDAGAARMAKQRSDVAVNSGRVSGPSRAGLLLGLAGTGLETANTWQRHRPKS